VDPVFRAKRCASQEKEHLQTAQAGKMSLIRIILLANFRRRQRLHSSVLLHSVQLFPENP
jgi:hypothetical protein